MNHAKQQRRFNDNSSFSRDMAHVHGGNTMVCLINYEQAKMHKQSRISLVSKLLVVISLEMTPSISIDRKYDEDSQKLNMFKCHFTGVRFIFFTGKFIK